MAAPPCPSCQFHIDLLCSLFQHFRDAHCLSCANFDRLAGPKSAPQSVLQSNSNTTPANFLEYVAPFVDCFICDSQQQSRNWMDLFAALKSMRPLLSVREKSDLPPSLSFELPGGNGVGQVQIEPAYDHGKFDLPSLQAGEALSDQDSEEESLRTLSDDSETEEELPIANYNQERIPKIFTVVAREQFSPDSSPAPSQASLASEQSSFKSFCVSPSAFPSPSPSFLSDLDFEEDWNIHTPDTQFDWQSSPLSSPLFRTIPIMPSW